MSDPNTTPDGSPRQDGHTGHDKISGLFSSQEIRKVGTGTTTRKTIQKTFWYAKELDSGNVEVQPLNPNYVPSGPKREVPRDEFIKSFNPEPEFYVATVYPKMRELTKTVAKGERLRNNNELYSAELEFNRALNVDEENVRANFGLGLTYLERGEATRADDIFGRLVKLDAAFEPEHKHLFNEFGINLRKNKMYAQAIEYYERALELSGEDENLCYNMARALMEGKQPEKAAEFLLRALQLNPGLEEAVRFLMWIISNNMLPADKKAEAAIALKAAKEAAAGRPAASGMPAE